MNKKELQNFIDSSEWPADDAPDSIPEITETRWIKRKIDVSTPLGVTKAVVKCKKRSDGSYFLAPGEEERVGKMQILVFTENARIDTTIMTSSALHFILEILKIKQTELAVAVNVGRSAISNFISGKSSSQLAGSIAACLYIEASDSGNIKKILARKKAA